MMKAANKIAINGKELTPVLPNNAIALLGIIKSCRPIVWLWVRPDVASLLIKRIGKILIFAHRNAEGKFSSEWFK